MAAISSSQEDHLLSAIDKKLLE
jgi:hypothetical protein